jgi:membrane peptidoglycan carboxypeptidase
LKTGGFSNLPKIYDRTGEILLYDLHQDVKRTIVPFEQISRHLKNATVAIEDERFYSHFGIDLKAIVRAAVVNTTQGDLLGGQGGSTLTQQVIKNSVLERDKKLSRKVKEAILSIKLERTLSKDEILAVYLNEVPYGGTSTE